jgi:hypothetical protein
MPQATEAQNAWVRDVFGLDMSSSGDTPPMAGGRGAVSRRKKKAPPAPDGDVVKMWEDNLAQKNWPGAAFIGSALPKPDLAERIKALPDVDVAALYDAAVAAESNPRGNVTLATRDRALAFAKASHDFTRIAACLNGFGQRAIRVEMTKFSADDVKNLHDAAVASGDLGQSSDVAIATGSLAHPILGPMQQGRAAALEAKLSPEDQKKYHALLDAAKSAPEKQFITKGLAANHSVAELEAFAAKIAGKSADWMRDNLSLTGNSDGKGIKQQWHDSCGPTTYEAVQGELDPLYALKMHENNKKLTQADDDHARKLNPNMADDQRAVLTSTVNGQQGIAVARNQSGGKGMWIDPALNAVSASTGLTYSQMAVGTAVGQSSQAASIAKIADAAAKGRPVPILIGPPTGDQLHYVLVTATDAGPPRLFTMHDPWDGKTVIRTEAQITGGQIDLAGHNYRRYVEVPQPVALP